MAIIASGSFTSAATPVDKIVDVISDFDTFRFFVQGNSSGDIWESTANPGVVKEAYWFRGMTSAGGATAPVGMLGTREDYFVRELQNIGQQQVCNAEIEAGYATSFNAAFGYQDR